MYTEYTQLQLTFLALHSWVCVYCTVQLLCLMRIGLFQSSLIVVFVFRSFIGPFVLDTKSKKERIRGE